MKKREFWQLAAFSLPKKLIYWCAVVVLSESSTYKQFSRMSIGSIKALDSIEAYFSKNIKGRKDA
jgi:hypothetical protein